MYFSKSLSIATLGLLLSGLAAVSPSMAAPKVVVSIKPLESLVASIMQGVGKPTLLVKGASSPHTYSMRPSDAEDLQDSDVIFWAGPALENFMQKPLDALAGDKVVVALMEAPGVKLMPPREDGNFEADDDGDAHAHGADGEEVDPHFWLDPENARAAAGTIVSVLSAEDPENAHLYSENGASLDVRLATLENEIQADVKPLSGKPYIVFHDAYHYFEKRFGLSAVGSITVNPQSQPGAARISEIEEKIKSLGTVCIFTEPQFAPRLVQSLTNGNNVRSGELDPIGSTLPEGPDMYENLLKSIASNLKSCLMPS